MTPKRPALDHEHAGIELIETMRIEPSHHVPLLAGHWRRLESSCKALGYEYPRSELEQAVEQHIGTLDKDSTHRLRVLLGPNRRYSLESSVLTSTRTPVRLWLAPGHLQADAFWLQYKTTRRPWYEQDKRWLAMHPDFFDVVHCNARAEVCEGSRSNVYIRDAAGRWLTPPRRCGLLAGVQRQALLDAGLVHEAGFSREDLLRASAVRISNALRGWLDATLDEPASDDPASDDPL